jgi:serine/threonine-protein kinase
MSVHDSRSARAAAAGKDYGESANETSTVFEWTARRHTSGDDGDNLKRTSSIFEWPTQQQTAKHREENLKRTSMIFERPTRRPAAEDRDRVKPLHTNGTEVAAKPHKPLEKATQPLANRSPAPREVIPAPETDLVGRTLANKYILESVIGTGSMGTIYRARQISLDKLVSIKILHRELAEQRTFVERFKLEAFSASRLEHPNSLRVLDFGADGNLLHLVMEYVEADDLLTVMQREWPFHDARIVEIMGQALAALAKAHEVGIVHRDIKPENILILRGTDDEGHATDVVKVCDFGIAKMAGASAPQARPFAPHLTTEGLVVGTPDYMSPEQARGEAVDGRSDLYSMGVVLYHLLAGRPPFLADTPFGIAIQHVSQAPSPPSAHRMVSAHLEAICLRAMSKRPEDRFQSAREMRRALLESLPSDIEEDVTPVQGTPAPIMAFPWNSASGVPAEAPFAHSPPPPSIEPAASREPIWRRRPDAVVAAIAVLLVVTLALIAAISRLRGQDSSWGDGNHVVRATTIALTPAAPTSTATSPRPSSSR